MLAKPNIDTGLGLERLAVVMQDVNNLFEVDTVAAVLHHVERIAGKKYGENEKDDISIRVITDHIRATVFMASDGILPSNEGRGYVMRRLLRRAARHGRMLGINRPFLTELVETVIESSEAGYPELREHESYIKKVIGTEELRFGRTIDAGLNILTGMMGRLKEAHEKVLSGVEAFKLNDTFGFPLDLTREIAAEAGFAVDEAAFHIEMTKQRERARAERLAKDISGWSADLFGELTAEPTQFDGYETLSEKAKVLALSDGEELVDAIATDEAGEAKDGVLVVLDRTPFYAEMGGQVADHGYFVSGDAKLKVTQVKKTPKGYFVHTCELLDGTIHVDDEVTASVDEKRRAAICRNHTATHLLQKALREVLGEHVHQAGSYQDDQITHFDFTHFSAVSPAELAEVERRVNEKIYEALPVTVKNLPIEEAKKMGAMALFGEKYGSVVRVVDAGGWSTEFCGGTHVTNTAQIGCFKILSESSVAAGIRRIEATTAFGVLDLLDDRTEILAKTAVALKANNLKDAPARAEALAAELKETAKQLEILKAQMAAAKIDGLFENAADIDGVRIVSAYLTGTGADTLRDMVDKVRDKAPNAVTVLIGSDGNKTMMAVGVSKNAMARGLKAGALVKKIAAIAGGNGGGKPDFAMAGIRDTSKIDDALNAVPEIVKAEMNQ
uniref:alanine--tRNA ligase n=1 Tax=Gemmiger formicilis TaxID=745368 RepID=UPI003FED680D